MTEFRPTNARNVLACVLAVLAGTAANAPALGPDDPPDEVKGSFDRPLGQASTPVASAVSMFFSQSDGKDTYTLTIRDGVVSAEVNGKPVPPDRVRRTGDRYEILDAQGKVLTTFNAPKVVGGDLGLAGPRARAWRQGGADAVVTVPAVPGTPGAPGLATTPWAVEPANPPPVMLGITMSDPDPALADHLGLEEGQGIVVDAVLKDLPADKAGLKPKDIIIEVNGQKGVGQGKLRELLHEKKPGDTLKLVVLRKGKEETVTVDLQAYDAEKIQTLSRGTGRAPTMVFRDVDPMAAPEAPQPPAAARWRDEARKALEDGLRQLQDARRDMKSDEMREHARKALQEALEAMRAQRDAFAERFQGGFRLAPDGEQQWQLFVPEPGRTWRIDNRLDEALDRLSGQLDRLSERLTDLEKRLDKAERK